MKNSDRTSRTRFAGIAAIAVVAVLASGCGGGGSGGGGASTATGAIWLSWQPPSERESGEALPFTDLSGYRIYWGPAEDPQMNQLTVSDRTATTYQINGVAPGTYQVAISAIDSSGLESQPSAPMEKSL